MANSLEISSSLAHDGDELVRFRITTLSKDFSGSVEAWGYADNLGELAAKLQGFPQSDNSSVHFQFGSPQTGFCKLEFVCIDAVAHCGVWVTMEAAYPAVNQGFEKASIFFRVEPAAIDRFSSSLRAFNSGAIQNAALQGVAP